MTIVCPKCMHKSADDQNVCEKCGALLVSTAQSRAVRAPDDLDIAGSTGAATKSRGAAARAATSVDRGDGGLAGGKIATNGDSMEALKEALGYLESESPAERLPKYQPGRPGAPGPKPDSGPRFNRKTLTTIVVTLVAIIAVSLYFGLKGSPSPKHTSGGGTATTAAPAILFQFSGSGTSTTGSFTTNAPFTFTYRVSCPDPLTAPATFTLQRAGKKVDLVSSAIGGAVEKGTRAGFGVGGSYEIVVGAPTTCTWTVSGMT